MKRIQVVRVCYLTNSR